VELNGTNGERLWLDWVDRATLTKRNVMTNGCRDKSPVDDASFTPCVSFARVKYEPLLLHLPYDLLAIIIEFLIHERRNVLKVHSL